MDGGQGSARKLHGDAVAEMEGQTQTESRADERRRERWMEVSVADRNDAFQTLKERKWQIKI